MRVLLVNPPKQNFYRQLRSALPPLGIAYLGAVLRSKGQEVQLLDFDADPKARWPVNLGRDDLVGISADTIGYPAAIEIAATAKQAGARVVMGGYHVTFQDEEALRSGVVDYVIRGEGEQPLLSLIEALEGNCPLEEVSSLSFLENGMVIRTPLGTPVEDLDALPFPARDLLPMRQYRSFLEGRRMTSIITSRGCPFNCAFCASSQFAGLKWRARSATSIADEVELLRRDYGYRTFAFMDDNFTLKPDRIIALADELDRRSLEVSWWCFSRADAIAKNEPMVRRMAEAGARQVFLGLESASQQVLDGYRKRLTLEQQREAIAMLRRYGIRTYGAFIIGDPGETAAMVEQTVQRAIELNPYIAQFSLLTPYPGTALFDRACREGRLLHRDWRLYDGLHAVIQGNFLRPAEVQKMLSWAYRRFYLRLSYLKTVLGDLVHIRHRPLVELRRGILALRTGKRLKDYAHWLEKMMRQNPLSGIFPSLTPSQKPSQDSQ